MTSSKQRLSNSKWLKSYSKTASGDTKIQIDNIITLYSDGRISQLPTAINLIDGLTTTDKRKHKAGIKRYTKEISKHETQQPLKHRLREKQAVRIQKLQESNQKEYLIDVFLYSMNQQIPTQRPDFKKYGESYYCLGARGYRQLTVKAPSTFPSNHIKTKITQAEEDKQEWSQAIKILKTSTDFKKFYVDIEPYLAAVYFASPQSITPSDKAYDHLNESLQDATKVSFNCNYIETSIKLNVETFKEAVENTHCVINECWINSIYDVYHEALLLETRRRHITRKTIISNIGMTEESIKHGISVEQFGHFSENIIYNYGNYGYMIHFII